MLIARSLTSLLAARTAVLPVALCRIGLGVAAFGRTLKTARDLYLIAYDPAALPAPPFDWSPRLDSMPSIVLIGGAGVFASLGIIAGYRARLCALVVVASIAFLYIVDQNFWGHHVYFLGLMLLLLAFSDSDGALSVREPGLRQAASTIAWPPFLMKVQLSLVYFYAAAAKLNPFFLAGGVVATGSMPESFRTPAVLTVLAIATVAAELFLSYSLWVPRLRVWGAVAGVALHTLVPAVLGFYAGLIVFTVSTLSIYVLFFDALGIEALATRVGLVRPSRLPAAN